jgi:hypothetical protein
MEYLIFAIFSCVLFVFGVLIGLKFGIRASKGIEPVLNPIKAVKNSIKEDKEEKEQDKSEKLFQEGFNNIFGYTGE